MKRANSHTALRPRTLTARSARSALMRGKVVLLHVSDLAQATAIALRYAREGADLALAYDTPSEQYILLQQKLEALGSRCMLYELDLSDEWNCGLVLQSASECLGSVDLVVDRQGRVHGFEESLRSAGTLARVLAPSRDVRIVPPAHTAA